MATKKSSDEDRLVEQATAQGKGTTLSSKAMDALSEH
jgi:hypothetical protein